MVKLKQHILNMIKEYIFEIESNILIQLFIYFSKKLVDTIIIYNLDIYL